MRAYHQQTLLRARVEFHQTDDTFVAFQTFQQLDLVFVALDGGLIRVFQRHTLDGVDGVLRGDDAVNPRRATSSYTLKSLVRLPMNLKYLISDEPKQADRWNFIP